MRWRCSNQTKCDKTIKIGSRVPVPRLEPSEAGCVCDQCALALPHPFARALNFMFSAQDASPVRKEKEVSADEMKWCFLAHY